MIVKAFVRDGLHLCTDIFFRCGKRLVAQDRLPPINAWSGARSLQLALIRHAYSRDISEPQSSRVDSLRLNTVCQDAP